MAPFRSIFIALNVLINIEVDLAKMNFVRFEMIDKVHYFKLDFCSTEKWKKNL